MEAGVPQPLKGVGSRGWADEVVGSPTPFRDALLTVGLQDASGVGRDGRAFKQPMARQIYFSRMTETDIDAIVAWLRTLPPIE